MKMILLAALLAVSAAPSAAQNLDAPRAWLTGGIPVFEGDLRECPYHVVSSIQVDVRPKTIVSHLPDDEKIVAKIRERAARLRVDVDAVVDFNISAAHKYDLWAKEVTGTGKAIKFVRSCPRLNGARE